jgi:hypothetical protein
MVGAISINEQNPACSYFEKSEKKLLNELFDPLSNHEDRFMT